MFRTIRHKRLPFLAALAFSCCAMPARSLAFTPPAAITSGAPDASRWPNSVTTGKSGDVLVVTLAKPKVSQRCHFQSIDPEHLTCSSRFGRKPVTFDRSQIQALILPGYRPRRWLYDLICGAFAGGSIYGAVILTGISVWAAIPGIAMAVVVTFDALWLVLEANTDFGPDELLYLKPGEQLTVSFGVEP